MARKARGISRLVQVLGAGRGRYRATVLITAVFVAMFAAPSFASAEEVYVSVTTTGVPSRPNLMFTRSWGSKWSMEPAAAERSTLKKCTKISPAWICLAGHPDAVLEPGRFRLRQTGRRHPLHR